jgi:diguanylate cyclase (GGDEF)-like protein/PAS domain S-box-containing protein
MSTDVDNVNRTFQLTSDFGSKEWFDTLFAASPVGISITRARDHTLIAVNDAWLELMGYKRHEVIGRTRTELNLWADLAERDAISERIRKYGSLRNIEVRYRRKTGEHSVLFGALEMIEVAGERYVLGTAFDISDRKRTEDRYQHLATHDALTDLPNRALLMDRLGQAIRNAERHHSRVAVLFIDLDGFKSINDNFGHRMGDELLKSVAVRLTATVRDADTVARLSGDEFVVILDSWHTNDEVATLADKLCAAFSLPFEVNGRQIRQPASIGVSVYPDDGLDGASLMDKADRVMYRVKKRGGGWVRYAADEVSFADLAAKNSP